MSSVPLKVLVSLVSVVSLFVFPWQVTLLSTIVASVFVPPIAVCVGILADVLYGNNITPYFGTLLGLVLSCLGFFVHQFLKTRIMSA